MGVRCRKDTGGGRAMGKEALLSKDWQGAGHGICREQMGRHESSLKSARPGKNSQKENPEEMKIATPPPLHASPNRIICYSSRRLVGFCLQGEPNCSQPEACFVLGLLHRLEPHLWSAMGVKH